jgi:hypothetical protein
MKEARSAPTVWATYTWVAAFGILAEPAASAKFRDDRRRRLLDLQPLGLRPFNSRSFRTRPRTRPRTRSKPWIPPPPRLRSDRILPLQLTAPVAEVLQIESVLLAIFPLRQATKLPDLKVAAPECPCRPSILQTKRQCGSPHPARMRDRSGSHHRGREQTVQEMDAYNGSLIRAENSLIIP